jgi:hypothetical protein
MLVNMPPSYGHTLVRTKDEPAEERYQVDLVRRSIKDIERALDLWRDTEANPRATEAQRQEARERVVYRERDFGGQWANVKSILSRFKEK